MKLDFVTIYYDIFANPQDLTYALRTQSQRNGRQEVHVGRTASVEECTSLDA